MNLNTHPHPYGIVIAGNDLGTGQQSFIYCAAYGNGSGDPSVARGLTMGYLLIYNGSTAFIMTALFMAAAGYATLATGILPR